MSEEEEGGGGMRAAARIYVTGGMEEGVGRRRRLPTEGGEERGGPECSHTISDTADWEGGRRIKAGFSVNLSFLAYVHTRLKKARF